MHFLSERSILMHKEYLKDIKLKISVFEKSYHGVSNIKLSDIPRLKILPAEREALLYLKFEELLHEVYFSSFGEYTGRCEKISREYGSEANFLYKLISESRERDGFIMIYIDRGSVRYYIGRDYNVLLKIKPTLAVDLCEHAYLFDYGFDRDRYLKNALNALNLSKI